MKGFMLIALLLTTATSQAEMFKCVGANGHTSFQAQPCSDNQITEWQRETKKERLQRERQEATEAIRNQQS